MTDTVRALIADDSEDDALLIVRSIERSGLKLEWLRVQSEDALVAALADDWQIILSDYSMPSFTGLDVLRLIQRNSLATPVIIISGTIGEETAVAAMQAGARDYFLKDRLTRLGAAVRQHIADARSFREKQAAEEELRKLEKQLTAEREEAFLQEKAARRKIEALYEEAQEAARMKERFLVTVSHELRTPMTAITGWAELLFRGDCDPAEHPFVFETIHRNARLQNQLIDNLLRLTEMTMEPPKPERTAFNIAAAVDSVVRSFAADAGAKRIEIRQRHGQTVRKAVGDAGRLREILGHLLSNAIKFTPHGGHVEIATERHGDNVELKVTDDGEGIDPRFLPRVFDKFSQADGNLTRKHGGMGVGLAITRYLAGLMGGRVTAESAGLGKGTTMTVFLPLPAAELSSSAEVG